VIGALALLALLAAAPGEVVDRVAATVDGEVVTLSEIEDRAGAAYARAERLPPGKERDEARGEALRRAFDQIVAEKLLQKQAQALQLEVTEPQINAAIDDIKARNRFGDEDLDRALARCFGLPPRPRPTSTGYERREDAIELPADTSPLAGLGGPPRGGGTTH
jgi:peptidyl-prolyl cis-trans isomerase SurA